MELNKEVNWNFFIIIIEFHQFQQQLNCADADNFAANFGESKRKLVKRQDFLGDFSLWTLIDKERIPREYSRFIEQFHYEVTVMPNNFKIRSISTSHAAKTVADIYFFGKNSITHEHHDSPFFPYS